MTRPSDPCYDAAGGRIRSSPTTRMSTEKDKVGALPKLALSDEPSSDPWAGVVQQVVAGDRAALATLYDGTSAKVYGLVLRIVRDEGAAEEVTGDVYLQIWRQAVRFEAERGTALRWLLTVARSRAIDRLRSRQSRARESEPLELAAHLPAVEPGPEEQSADSQRRRVIQRALATIPPEQRRAIELAYWGGLSHSAVAETLGEPLGTVKTRIRVGMQRLRETLERLGREIL